MRVFSFAQESTRYCNYSKDKFNNELVFIQPCWIKDNDISYWKEAMSKNDWYSKNTKPGINMFIHSLEEAEDIYLALVKEEGWIAQQARAVLPNSLKTELVMTGFIDDWWGEYLVFNKETEELIQRIHGSLYEGLSNIDRDKYRIVESGFFPLRCSKGAHPQAYELAYPLREEFIKRGYLK